MLLYLTNAALEVYCKQQSIKVDEWMSDIGSGLNYKRKQFNRLMEMVELGQVRRIVIAHKDRLVRFGYGYFEAFCQRHNTEMMVGKDLEIISEKYTSQDCHACGNRQSMPLWKRTYHCERCGMKMDRDENSAHNILQRFLARLEPYTGDPVRCADVFTATEYV